MRTVTSVVVVATVMVVGTATAVFADSFTSSNVRTPQVNVNLTSGPDGLQDILNQIFQTTPAAGGPNALTDQTPVSMWATATAGFVVSPVLQFQEDCADCSYGIWSATDTANISRATLFSGTDPHYPLSVTSSFPDEASVFWSTTTSGEIIAHTTAGWTGTSFSGIDSNDFGFYLVQGGNTYYTADALNGGTARALTYQDGNSTNWAIAFDGDTNGNFNAGVLSVESLDAAMPEPGTLALFGSGLVVGIGKLRRRWRRS
jgi:hypothetical protein